MNAPFWFSSTHFHFTKNSFPKSKILYSANGLMDSFSFQISYLFEMFWFILLNPHDSAMILYTTSTIMYIDFECVSRKKRVSNSKWVDIWFSCWIAFIFRLKSKAKFFFCIWWYWNGMLWICIGSWEFFHLNFDASNIDGIWNTVVGIEIKHKIQQQQQQRQQQSQELKSQTARWWPHHSE